MDKKLILAVAGSGKTTKIISSLSLEKQSLIVTYTKNNAENLRLGIINKFGYFPKNISLMTYFAFVHSFCYSPFLKDRYRTTGIYYGRNNNRYARNEKRYITQERRLYSNRIAKFIAENKIIDSVVSRIERYFDDFFIDEIQDFAGHDFDLLSQISIKLECPVLYVGDYFQHTYDTSRDDNVNRNLHSNFPLFKRRFIDMGLEIDEQTLSHSYRCCPEVCEFVSVNLGIDIKSHRSHNASVNYVDDPKIVTEIVKDDSIVKLFYQKHYEYKCYSRNWGDCKGENGYRNICVMLNNSTLKKYKSNNLHDLPERTRNKLYVALTRANESIILVPESMIRN